MNSDYTLTYRENVIQNFPQLLNFCVLQFATYLKLSSFYFLLICLTYIFNYSSYIKQQVNEPIKNIYYVKILFIIIAINLIHYNALGN